MDTARESLFERLEKLGLECDVISLDRMTSATAALACFPMYMVANVHLWTAARQFEVPILGLPGAEAILEQQEIARQLATWDLSEAHRRALGTMLTAAKPSDRVIYDYALETLKDLLGEAGPELAETVRAGIARMIVAVANAAGSGPLGTGPKVSPEERACILKINHALGLDRTEAGAWLIQKLGG